jgi:hypothetical protein
VAEKQKVPLLHGGNHFMPGDLRKFCEQMGDILQWDQSNKNYLMTHGVSGVDWRFYKRPLPQHVYDVYIKSGERSVSTTSIYYANYRPSSRD